MLPQRSRSRAAAVLAAAGIVSLAASALRLDAPIPASLSLARKFWRASPRARVLNSRLFQADVELGVALMGADRSWPLATDADLILPSRLSDEEVEEKRRKAAFVLAPRRVFIAREPFAAEDEPFRLRPRTAQP